VLNDSSCCAGTVLSPGAMRWRGRVCAGGLVILLGFGAAEAGTRDGGIEEHLDVAIKSAREAREALLTGNTAACVDAVKRAKQSMKEVSGSVADLPARQDTLGKPMHESLRSLQDTKAVCAPENQGAAVATLSRVAERLQEFTPQPKNRPGSD